MSSRTMLDVDDVVNVDSFLDSYLLQLQTNYTQQIRANQQNVVERNPPRLSPQNDALPSYDSPLYDLHTSTTQIQSNQAYSHNVASFAGTYYSNSMQPNLLMQRPFTPESESNAQPASVSHKRTGRQVHLPINESNIHASDSDNPSLSGDSDDKVTQADRTRKKREQPITESERRCIAVKEKNKRAQRRFREKQKSKFDELRAKIELLSQKINSLQSENSALYSRTSILEKVLDIRNEQIQATQDPKAATPYFPLQAEDATSETPLMRLTPQMIKDLSPEQIYKIYQTFVKTLSSKLSLDGKLLEGTDKDVDQLVKDLLMLLERLAIVKPSETKKFVIFSRQGLGNTEEEVVLSWKKVVLALQLSEEVKQEMVEARRPFLEKWEAIMEERRELNAQIHARMAMEPLQEVNGMLFVNAHETVVNLRKNLRTELDLLRNFTFKILAEVLSPLDFARCVVKCFPAVPDPLGMASALAIDFGTRPIPADHTLVEQMQGLTLEPSLVSFWGPPAARGVILDVPQQGL